MRRDRLLIIDPQNDFTEPSGSLYVKGAAEDMLRLASFVRARAPRLESIHVTLDSHSQLQIFHPLFWRDLAGKPPPPFTLIGASEVEAGIWTARCESARDRALEYVRALERSGRFSLVIWPYHCLAGSKGAAVQDGLFSELCAWERLALRTVDYVRKGSNGFTEHYSALKAEVEDSSDDSTKLNAALVEALLPADRIYIAGEAFDYCVYNTVLDLVMELKARCPERSIPSIAILEDCTSPIDAASAARIKREFEALGIRFVSGGAEAAKEFS